MDKKQKCKGLKYKQERLDKQPKEGTSGITLVALVVTIVVLIILAVVTINVVLGDGIIAHARKAKEGYTKAQVKETVQSEVFSSYGEDVQFDLEIFKENIYKDLGIDSTEIQDVGKNGGISFRLDGFKLIVDNNGNILIYEDKIPTLTSLADDSISGYVNYPIDLDNNPETMDWKMFYQDEDYAYIISADYLLWSKVPEAAKAAGLQQSAAGAYSVANMYWADLSKVTSRLSKISDDVKEKFHFKLYNTNTDQPNTYATANLLDSNNWSTFALGAVGAEAIGSPTLELWRDSWNQSYPKDPLSLELSGTTGYLIGTSSASASIAVDMKNTDGYNNTLYYPHPVYENIPNGIGVSNGFWLASPSAHVNDRLCRVGYDGSVGGGGFALATADGFCSLRPVVCIPKSTNNITQNANQVWLINE